MHVGMVELTVQRFRQEEGVTILTIFVLMLLMHLTAITRRIQFLAAVILEELLSPPALIQVVGHVSINPQAQVLLS